MNDPNIEIIARKLYSIWSDGNPDWGRWADDADLNGAGLTPNMFRESAETVRDGLATVLCLNNTQWECMECTHETCNGASDWRNEANALLAQRIEHEPSKLGVDGSNPSERAKSANGQ